jgi:23S rRNA U2552 (ribose-2'-O)-methylase RlmE/FtsJ
MYNPYDFYFKKAKEVGYKARSAFKLDEIQDKFHVFDKSTKVIVDIWCAPGSWLQYAVSQEQKNNIKWYKIIWFDMSEAKLVESIENLKKLLEEKKGRMTGNEWMPEGILPTKYSDKLDHNLLAASLWSIALIELLKVPII